MTREPLQLPSLRALAGLDDAGVLDLLEWTERHRRIRGARMRTPRPLREIYQELTPEVAS